MRKGDEKKQEILNVAEQLFCQRGYSATSIQDILDVLHTSKGSFYHHFISKDQVLEQLCERRAMAAAVETAQQLADLPEGDPARLSLVLNRMLPLRKSDADFLAVLLPLMFTCEGRSVCVAYQDALTAAYQPILEKELDSARRSGLICPPGNAGIAPVLSAVINRCWLDTAAIMVRHINTPQAAEPPELLEQLNRYRAAVERLLDAPFGSIVLVSLEDWLSVRQAIAQRILGLS